MTFNTNTHRLPPWAGRPHVHHGEWLSPNIVRVTLHWPGSRDIAFSAGDKLKLDVGGALRSYTPSAWNNDRECIETIVYARQGTPGGNWARSLHHGLVTKIYGPKRSLDGRIPSWANQVLFFGDETTIGLAEAIERELPKDAVFKGAIECQDIDVPAVRVPGIVALARGSEHGIGQRQLLRDLLDERPVQPDTLCLLSGETDTVVALKNTLREAGASPNQIRAKPYWARKGKLHRKFIERTALRR